MKWICALAVAGLTGCQSYKPQPWDFAAHDIAWENRDPASDGVAEFARRLSTSGSALQGSFDPTDGLSLAESRVVALFFNPQLRAERLKARAQAVSAAEAGRWQDPVLRVDAERIISSVSHPWVVGGLLELTLPVSGTPRLEQAMASAEAESARIRALSEEQRIVSELDEAWLQLTTIDQRIAIAQQIAADLSKMVDQAKQLQQAGEMSALEAGLFRMEHGRRQAELRSLAPRRQELEIAVRSLMGLKPSATVRLVPALPEAIRDDLPTPADRQAWVVQNHPRLRQARADYVVAERRLELEIRRQFPNLSLGAGYGRDEGTNRILGGLGIPIPIFNANRRRIAEASVQRDTARAEAEAEYEQLLSSLAQAEAALEAAQTQFRTLQQEVAPLIDQQLQAVRAQRQIGNVSPLVVFETVTRAYETRLEVLDAAATVARAQTKINALIRPIAGVQPTLKENP